MSRMISVPRGRQRYVIFVIDSLQSNLRRRFCSLSSPFRLIKYVAVADLAAREDKPLEGFGLFGVVKEVGVDDEGMKLYIEHFSSMH